MLRDDHDHDHADKAAHHHDHNFRAAYVHVLADAATSLLALAALGWRRVRLEHLDPAVGVLGAIVISRWAVQLLKQRASCRSMSKTIRSSRAISARPWSRGNSGFRWPISISGARPRASRPDRFAGLGSALHLQEIKNVLRTRHTGLSHVTIEVAVCEECAPPQVAYASNDKGR